MGEGEGGTIWRNGTETCIMSYKKQIANPGSMHDTGHSGLVHWDGSEGWDGDGSGRGFRMGNTCTPMADSCQCMAKPTSVVPFSSRLQSFPVSGSFLMSQFFASGG